jgi:YaaC-like protein
VNDWTRITFLESAENLKSPLKALTGRTPSTSIAREVGVCVQQGRLFFESAGRSALEIRPLLLFYGTLAFAKALVVGRTLQSIATLPQAHGVKDVSSPSARVMELTVKIGSSGTFQRFNDVAAQLNRFEYFDRESMTQSFMLPAAFSQQIESAQFTLKEILSRIPGLEGIYRRTFHEPANTEAVSMVNPSRHDDTYWELRIDDRELFSDRTSLKELVRKWRDRFPVLERMRVVEAVRAWDNAIVLFGNVAVPPGELDDEWLSQQETRFFATDNPAQNVEVPRLPIESLIGPDGGAFAGARSLISPHQGIYASKYALHYLGMFMLSSLVRYRPQTWVHAISRTATAEKPTDDQALTLLEEFMKTHAAEVPNLIAGVFNS